MQADDANHIAALLDQNPFWPLGLIARREIRCWSPFFGAKRLKATAV